MEILRTISTTRDFLQEIKNTGKSIGFVPTMGALHEGHLDLMRRARKETDFVAVSIFVNPIQFNNKEDLEKYPSTLEDDILKLRSIPCDLLFNPTALEMYPEPVNDKYNFGSLENVLEGRFRPGHFNGVAVVVRKLFEIIEPDRSYFGEKDYQQLRIIESLVNDYQIPVDIIPCPTVREEDGLAMSSRNKRLSKKERKIAPVIYKTLEEARKLAYETPVTVLIRQARENIENINVFNLEYLEIVDGKTLLPVDRLIKGNKYIICIAAQLGNVRLIDNVIIR